ncbi:interleukin-31 receptor subunit alpha [Tachyglossus aculeatus]|uniref:interleukin-31 receptor subunit alpha n=1 Tax=Tachyglossus aculeatus TaxID=9261 RepID=UPI0018F6F5FA|nr:interleukin-31 receptor subunit alpha [Tachyglossus aculeatus]
MWPWALWVCPLLCGINLAAPPDKPQNISCSLYYSENLTCTWDPGREVYPANFTVSIKSGLSIRSITQHSLCRSSTNSCSFRFSDLLYPSFSIIEVTTENAFGVATSNATVWNLHKIVRIGPPTIRSVEMAPGAESSLLVTWERPSLAPEWCDLICCLRHRKANSVYWEQVTLIMGISDQSGTHTLSGLDCADYTVSMRCEAINSEFWSAWSEEKTGTVERPSPACGGDLWRVIGPTGPDGKRTVWLMRKGCCRRSSGYSVNVIPEKKPSLGRTVTTTSWLGELSLTGEAYLVSLVDYNSTSASAKATLRIPPVGESPPQRIKAVTVQPVGGDGLVVAWDAPASDVERFVVEWRQDWETEPAATSWEYVSQGGSWTAGGDSFLPFQCYNISVYPLLKELVGAPVSTQVYFREGVPSEGPVSRAENLGKHEATIKWNEISKKKRNGFIRNYTLFYGAVGGEEMARTVNSSFLQSTLEGLEPDTQYTARVLASTSAGGRNGTKITFRTLAFGNLDVFLLAAPIGGSLLLLIVLVAACSLSKPKLKQAFCPRIPDPAESVLSEWLTRVNTAKEQLRERPSDDSPNPSNSWAEKPGSSPEEFPDKLVVDCWNILEQEDIFPRASGRSQVSSSFGEEYEYLQVLSRPNSWVLVRSPSRSSCLPEETPETSPGITSEAIPQPRPLQNPGSARSARLGVFLEETATLNPYLKNSITVKGVSNF